MAKLDTQRILIVEDEVLIALCLEDFVREMDLGTVTVAWSSAAAYQYINQDPPTFALLDVVLSDGSGFDIADRLVELGIPFVFTTGMMPSEIPLRFRDRQTCDKPLNFSDLAATIENAIVHRSLASV